MSQRHSWEKTFEIAAPVSRVWEAFTDPEEFGKWAQPPRVDAEGKVTYEAAGAQVEIKEVQRNTYLHWEEIEGERATMEVAFTETETGTRITLTRSGFGEGEEWVVSNTSKLLGWTEAFADLAAYLESGVVLGRHFENHSATGIVCFEDRGGLRVLRLEPGAFGERAGLEPGDVVVRLGGAAIFNRTNLWFAQRLFAPGAAVSVEYVRDGELRSGTAEMSPMSHWARPGELGGATYPKEATKR